jgi:hypothetical protein
MNKVHFQDLQDWLYLVEPECRQKEMKTLRAPLLLLKERAALTPTRTEMDIHFPQSQTVCDDVPYLLRMLASTQESKIASRINPRDREWCTMIVKYSRNLEFSPNVSECSEGSVNYPLWTIPLGKSRCGIFKPRSCWLLKAKSTS